MLRRARAGVLAELGHVGGELRRLHGREEHPRVPLATAVTGTVLLVLWGNGVVLAGRRLDAPDAVTLAANPAAALGVTLLLLRSGWRPGELGFRSPVPQPSSRGLRVILGALAALVVPAAAAAVVVLDPSKRLDVLRLLLGTAAGEEVLHRSALLAVWSSTAVPPAVTTAVSAAAFGAWHVAGAFHGGTFHPLEVAVPAAGTLVFLWARLRYRSVAAPIILHVATNLPGIALGR